MTVTRRSATIAIVAASALQAAPCAAGQATNQMPVTVTIPAGCQLTTRPLDFGTVTIVSPQVDATSTISLRCAPGTAYSVQLDNGLHANVAQRRMYSGPVGLALLRYVNYNLYRDSARSQLWSTATTISGIAPANGVVDVVVYGRMPVGLVMPVEYRDTVTVTVSF